MALGMSKKQTLNRYLLRLGDNSLVLGQRLIEIVANGPELEEELANANVALDYLGQARMFYSYAGELEGRGRTEDDLAFLRDEHEFGNLLLLEQPNGHFGDTIARQVFFDVFYRLQLEALEQCSDQRLAEIAAKSVREIRYHLRHANQWLVRLGDGTKESHERVSKSVHDLWRFSGEMFAGDELDDAMTKEWNGPSLGTIKDRWQSEIASVLEEATIPLPEDQWMAGGGKQGQHTEHFGYLIADMQYMQRSHPGANW
jgi:ring-1,2-phenylacetyl-CoA epoxidase subunit PaaC